MQGHSLVDLSTAILDPSNQITQGCAGDMDNTFVVTGRGGLPPDPRQILRDPTILQAFEPAPEEKTVHQLESTVVTSNLTSHQPSDVQPDPILEAQGWHFNEQGKVELVALLVPEQSRSWVNHPRCNSK